MTDDDAGSARDDEQIRHPQQIGGYVIQHVIGSGGMATVYAAIQERPRRTVALKILRPGASTRSALRRFSHEAEILAKLRHPYIAQVYDAGTHDDGGGGVPYFVMEYVPGAQTIVRYAQEQKLSVTDRLKLFIKVCAAVQHGHSLKIVHRDLKPGNILVDLRGEPKVIDFGVARAADISLSAQTVVTDAGRLVGTVQYMSPEQVAASPQDIDPRTDVYALGVVLYKLLCGRHPHELTGLPLHEAVRVIQQEAPTRPSQANPAIKGDLETILLKCLEKERSRRYRTAGSLGRDLVRYLADEPIHARRASAGYRVRLFVRRNRWPVTAALSVSVAVGAVAASAALLAWTPRGVSRDPPASRPVETVRVEAPPPSPPQAPVERVIATHGAAVVSLALSADGSRVMMVGGDGRAFVTDVKEGTRLRELDGTSFGPAGAISSDGRRIAVIRRGQRASVYDVDLGTIAEFGIVHSAPVTAVAVGSDGMLASASEDMTVRLLLPTEQQPRVFRGSRGAYRCLAVDWARGRIVVGSEGGVLELREIERDVVIWSHECGGAVMAVGLDIDGSVCAGTAAGRLVKVSSEGARQWTASSGVGSVSGISCQPEGAHLAVTGEAGIMLVCRDTDGQPVGRWPAETATMRVRTAAWDPQNRWIVVGLESGEVRTVAVESLLPATSAIP